jgi:hypothetical protein
MGKLYIANTSTSRVRYLVNGGAIPLGRPVSPGPRPPPYTPYMVFADFERKPDLSVLGYGDNAVEVSFLDDPAQRFSFTVTVSEGVSVVDDLIAAVFRGWLLFMTERGEPAPGNDLLIAGTPTHLSLDDQTSASQLS